MLASLRHCHRSCIVKSLVWSLDSGRLHPHWTGKTSYYPLVMLTSQLTLSRKGEQALRKPKESSQWGLVRKQGTEHLLEAFVQRVSRISTGLDKKIKIVPGDGSPTLKAVCHINGRFILQPLARFPLTFVDELCEPRLQTKQAPRCR